MECSLFPLSHPSSQIVEDSEGELPKAAANKTRYIQTWASHVHAAASLPPLTIIPPTHYSPYTSHYCGQTNHYFRVSLSPPPHISEHIRCQMAATVNQQSPWILLKELPHPGRVPLVSSFD